MCWANGRLYVSGHPYEDLVASVLPVPAGEQATLKDSFFSLANREDLDTLKLDTLVGITMEGSKWSLWQQFYDVDASDINRKSLCINHEFFQLGNGSIKKHAGYMTHYEGADWVGRSDGAGNVQVTHGPSLYRIGDDDFSLTPFPIPEREDWNEKDRYTGIFFAEGHVFWLVSKATGAVWYGTAVGPNGEIDEWDKSKGYHTDRREVWLLPYTWPALELRDPIKLPEFHASAKCGGVAYDEATKRLYVHELWPPEQDSHSFPWERPRIHMYDLGPEPLNPDEGLKIKFEFNGQIYEGTVFKS